MCEAFFSKFDNPNAGGFGRSMPVDIVDDGIADKSFLSYERFNVIKLPLVQKTACLKYLTPVFSGLPTAEPEIIIPRRWIMLEENLPPEALDLFQTQGFIVVKATPDYLGDYHYTWERARLYLFDTVSQSTETADLV